MRQEPVSIKCSISNDYETFYKHRNAKNNRFVWSPSTYNKQAAHIIAIACSDAPKGHEHWTLRLLADKVVALSYASSFSYEAVRQLLKKHTETLAETGMVYSRSECGICSGYGRRD